MSETGPANSRSVQAGGLGLGQVELAAGRIHSVGERGQKVFLPRIQTLVAAPVLDTLKQLSKHHRHPVAALFLMGLLNTLSRSFS